MNEIEDNIHVDKADEDIMIFWSREKLKDYFTKTNQGELTRRQQARRQVSKHRSRCASSKFFT